MSASHSSDVSPSVSTHGASFVATSVNHPKLLRSDGESICVFLRLYDQYANEVKGRAQKLTATESSSTEAIRPFNLKFCVDPEYIESALLLVSSRESTIMTHLPIRFLERTSRVRPLSPRNVWTLKLWMPSSVRN